MEFVGAWESFRGVLSVEVLVVVVGERDGKCGV